MHVLFSTGALYGAPLAWSMGLARAAGCDGVELVLDPWMVLFGPRAIARVSERVGLSVEVLHPSIFGFRGMNKPPQAFAQLGEWSRALEVGLVVLHPLRIVGLAENTARFDKGLEALRQAAYPDVRVSLENVPFFTMADRRNPFVEPEAVAEFARKRGLSVTLDTTHLASAGLDLLAQYDGVSGLVSHIHLSDYRQPRRWLDRPELDTYVKHHQLPGTGMLPLRQFVRHLRVTAYDGAITLEVSPVALQIWRPWRMLALLRRSVEYVRSAWDAGGAGPSGEPEVAPFPLRATLGTTAHGRGGAQ